MIVIIGKDSDTVAERAVSYIVKLIKSNPSAVLGLATGNTPIKLYERLVQISKQQSLSFKGITTFNLDEYIGIEPEHQQSYRYFMEHHLFQHVDIPKHQTHLPDCTGGANPFERAKMYDEQIVKAGGIDLQILGIGSNGHIGFNEPTSSLSSRTRIKTLTRQTIQDNSRFFQKGEFQPSQALTMGIGTIMESRQILILALGQNKAAAVKSAIEGPVSSMCPASALQYHRNIIFLVDEDASAHLELADYYKHVDELAQQVETKFYRDVHI